MRSARDTAGRRTEPAGPHEVAARSGGHDARRLGLVAALPGSRARVTRQRVERARCCTQRHRTPPYSTPGQGPLLLASDIQEEILFLELSSGGQPIRERALRVRVLKSLDWSEQRKRWAATRRTLRRASERNEAMAGTG